MKTILTSLLNLLIFFSLYSQSLTLKLNPELNKIYKFKTFSNQTLTQTMGNNEINTYISTSTVVSLKIIEKTNSFFICEVKFDTILANTKNVSMNIEINSTKPGNIKSNNLSEVMSAIIYKYCNNPLFLKINENGLITEIINYDVFKNLVLKDCDSISPAIQQQVKMQISNMLDEKQIKNSVEPLFSYIPEKQVSKNEPWKKIFNIESNGLKLNTENNYKIINIEKDKITISFESNITSTTDNIAVIQGSVIQYDLKGISKGNIKVDVNNGFIKEQSNKSTIEGNIMIDYNGNNISIPTKISGETTIRQL